MYSCHHFNQIRRISQAAFERLKPITAESLVCWANEDDPRRHTDAHEGLFYNYPADEASNLAICGQNSPFDIETTRFYTHLGRIPLMVRKPALSTFDYMNKLRPQTPNVRFLFYGDPGHGKTHTLIHLLHYLHLRQDHFIVHIREMKKYTRSPRSIDQSTSRPGRIDTNINAAIQLQQFKMQNSSLIEKHRNDLVCSQEYKWSLREFTKAGDSIFDIADHGINRVVHASDCFACLVKELMLAADSGKIKLASLLDNVKFLFSYEAGVLKHPDFKRILVDEVTVARAIKKLIKGSYKNGIVLATCDDKLSKKQGQTPGDTIGEDGWLCFDPFLPIHVPKYSRKEYESCMNLYQSLGWISRPEAKTQEARDEIRFISALNPGQVFELCKEL